MLSLIVVITFLTGGLWSFVISVSKANLGYRMKCNVLEKCEGLISSVIWCGFYCSVQHLKKIIKNKPKLILIGRIRKQRQMHVGTDCSPLIKPNIFSLQDTAKYFPAPGDNHAFNLMLIFGNQNSWAPQKHLQCSEKYQTQIMQHISDPTTFTQELLPGVDSKQVRYAQRPHNHLEKSWKKAVNPQGLTPIHLKSWSSVTNLEV